MTLLADWPKTNGFDVPGAGGSLLPEKVIGLAAPDAVSTVLPANVNGPVALTVEL